jgi:hypothetical protein
MPYSVYELNLSDLWVNVAYVKTHRGAPELEYALLELLEQEQVTETILSGLWLALDLQAYSAPS